MKISIITAVYNNTAHLVDCLNSISSQTHSHIEHIIIDGGSTDGTVEMIIKSYGNRISKWVSEPDKGIYDALNKGFAMAGGDIIGILHSDDLFADAFRRKSLKPVDGVQIQGNRYQDDTIKTDEVRKKLLLKLAIFNS